MLEMKSWKLFCCWNEIALGDFKFGPFQFLGFLLHSFFCLSCYSTAIILYQCNIFLFLKAYYKTHLYKFIHPNKLGNEKPIKDHVNGLQLPAHVQTFHDWCEHFEVTTEKAKQMMYNVRFVIVLALYLAEWKNKLEYSQLWSAKNPLAIYLGVWNMSLRLNKQV